MLRCGIAVCLTLLLAGCRFSTAIIGGGITTIEKHPYQVAIDNETVVDSDGNTQTELVCTGALISNNTVVTAASCAGTFNGHLNVTTLSVRVGAQFRNAGGERYRVVDYLPHPLYRTWLGDNNVMLLYLEEAVEVRAAVQPIALVPSGKPLAAREVLQFTGFGGVSKADAEPAFDELWRLRAATAPALDQGVCDWFYGFHWKQRNRACAVGVYRGTCGKGDLGAPVVNWRQELAGVAVVNSVNCRGWPVVFIDFSDAALHAWITANLNSKAPVPSTEAPTTQDWSSYPEYSDSTEATGGDDLTSSAPDAWAI